MSEKGILTFFSACDILFMKGVDSMKKFLCILLSVLLVASLWGCDTASIRGQTVGGEQNPSEAEFGLGTASGTAYYNNFLGIRCELPSGWVFYTDEQIREMNNITADLMGDEVKEILEKATIVYDMACVNGSTGDTINVNMEKLTALQLVGLDLKAVLEAQISLLQQTYENAGCTNIQIFYQKVKVDGKDFDALKFSVQVYGVNMYGVCFSFLRGNYIANVSLVSAQTDKVEEMLGYFTVR